MGVRIQLFEVPTAYSFRFLSEGMDEKRSLQIKVNTRDELVARITNSAALIKQERQEELRRTKGLKSALNLMVGFLNTYFELLQFIEIIYVTSKCNQHVICFSIVPFAKLFMCNIQTHTPVSPHPLKIGHMFV
jgi:hypothetical protein